MSAWRFVNPLAATTFLPDSKAKYIAVVILQLSGLQNTKKNAGSLDLAGIAGRSKIRDRTLETGERVVCLRRCHV